MGRSIYTVFMGDIRQPTPSSSNPSKDGMTAEVHAALALLSQARKYASDFACDPWEFAVEIDRLLIMGATTNDLRWLVKKGFVEHAREVTRPGDPVRQFERCQNLSFAENSCFLRAGAAPVSLESKNIRPETAAHVVEVKTPVPKPSNLVPHWDSDDRKLYVGDLVVKEFRVLSPNQEAILSAFEEEGWPHYVDDPLPPAPDQNPKHRLRDTIKWLNSNQKNHLIRFRGDGTGERIRWELTI
jgi:hypothetical protein